MSNRLLYRGGSSGKDKTIPDTFKSRDTFERILGLGEGPWWGPADGIRSLYVDQTPFVNSQNKSNFASLAAIFYPGSALGEQIKPWLGGVASPVPVGVTLAQNTPVVRNGLQHNLDWAELRLVVQALYRIDKGQREHKAEIKVEWRRSSSGTWNNAVLYEEPAPPPLTGPAGAEATYIVADPNNVTNATGAKVILATSPPGEPDDPELVWLDTDDSYKPYTWNATTSQWVTTAINSGGNWTFTNPQGQTRTFYQTPPPNPTALAAGDLLLYFGQVVAYNGTALADAAIGTTYANGVVYFNEKITVPTVRELRFPVDNVDEPLEYRVTQLTPDSGTDVFCEISFESVQEVRSDEYTFPNTAMLQVIGQATDQIAGNPTIQGIYKMRMVKVPVNYDPTLRTYTGVWDGTYKIAWTDCPAWIFMDYVENTTFGLSRVFPHVCDKWAIYQWALHCDTMVSDGKGGTRPRWTFNHVQATKIGAKVFAQNIAAAGGARYLDDGNGLVTVLYETPDEPVVALFTNEIVKDNLFRYSFTDRLTRANQVIVRFKNPDLFYKEDRRRAEAADDIANYGTIPEEFEAVGCRSVAEALARARYRLITAQTEKQFVSFQTHRKGRYLNVWQLIAVADADASHGISGTVVAKTGARTISIREPVVLEAGFTYTLQFDIPNPDYPASSDQPIRVYQYTIETDAGTHSSLTVDADLPATLPEFCTFGIGCVETIGVPKIFRVLSIGEVDGDPDRVEVTALECNRLKWDYIDGTVPDIEDDDVYSNYNGQIQPIDKINIDFQSVTTGMTSALVATLYWDKSATPYVKSYRVYDAVSGGASSLVGEVTSNRIVFNNFELGKHVLTVVPVDFMGRAGPERTLVADASGVGRPIAGVSNLRLSGGGSTFPGTTAVLQWNDDTPDTAFSHYLVEVRNTSTDALLRSESTTSREWTYDLDKIRADGFIRAVTIVVKVVDSLGNISTGVSKAISNPAPAAPTVTLVQVPGGVEVRVATPADVDFVGYKVYASGTSGFTPDDGTNLVFKGAVPPTLTGTPGGAVNVRVAAYDLFGETGLNLAAQVSSTYGAVAANTVVTGSPLDLAIGSMASASSSAAAAEADRIAAEAAKVAAETASGVAAGHASTASTAKGLAETAKGLAETARAGAELARDNAIIAQTSAQAVANQILPDRPAIAANFVTNGATSPEASTSITTGTVVAVPNEGDVRQFNISQIVVTRGALPVGTGRTFKVETRTRVTVDGTDNRTISGFNIYDEAWALLGVVNWTYDDTSFVIADGWQTYTRTATSAEIIAAWPTAAYVRARMQGGRNNGNTNSGATWQLAMLRLRDVTDVTETNAAKAAAQGYSITATEARDDALEAAANAFDYQLLAASSRDTASGHASAANVDAGIASTKASEAGASAIAAASSAQTAQSTLNITLPYRPSRVSDFATGDVNGNPDTIAALTGGTVVTVTNEGDVLQFTGIKPFVTRGWIPLEAGHTYRIRSRTKVATDGVDNVLILGFAAYSETGTYLGQAGQSSVDNTHLAADGWQNHERTVTTEAVLALWPTAAYIRGRIHGGRKATVTNSGAVWQTAILRLQDATYELLATTSASAAATSMSQAETFRNQAESFASAASGSATLADGHRSSASTFASQASEAKDDAEAAASNAELAEGAAVTARDLAQGHAAAAAGSMSLASGYATDAYNYSQSATTAMNTAQAVAYNMLPDRVEALTDFTNTVTDGTPAAIAAASSGTLVAAGAEGNVRQYTTGVNVLNRGWMSVRTDRNFQAVIRAAVTVDGTGNVLAGGFQAYDATGVSLGLVGWNIIENPHTVSDGWKSWTITTTSTAILAAYPTAAYIRARVWGGRNGASAASGATWRLAVLKLEDVTSMVAAQTAASAAVTARSEAQGFASDADADASAANLSRIAAEAALTRAHVTTALSFPSGFEEDGTYWTNVATGTTAANTSVHPATYVDEAGVGRVMQNSGFVLVLPRGTLAATPGAVYEAEVRFRATVDSTVTGGTKETFSFNQWQALNADGTAHSLVNTTAVVGFLATKGTVRIADGWLVFKVRYTVPTTPGFAMLRPRFYGCFDAGGNGNTVWQVAHFKVADVTATVAAEGFAGAASTSASAASASASLADGYKSNASTSASNAATSEYNAGQSAGAASVSATTASTKAGEASASANSAATSAQTARALTNRLLPAYPGQDPDAFTTAFSTYANPASLSNGTSVNETAEGAVWEMNGQTDVASKGLLPVTAGRKFRVGVRVRTKTDGSAASVLSVWLRSFNATGGYLAAHTLAISDSDLQAAEGWKSLQADLAADTIITAQPTAAYVRVDLRCGATGSTWQLNMLRFMDATETASAEASATSATASAATADGHRAAASASATLAANYYLNRLGSQMVDNPAVAEDFTNSNGNGTPAAIAASTLGTVVNVANEGDVREYTARADILTRGWLPLLAGRTYRMTTRHRVTVNGTDNRVLIGFMAYSSNGTALGVIAQETTLPVQADGWLTLTLTHTAEKVWATYSTAAYIRARVIVGLNAGGTNSGATSQVSILRMEDVTASAIGHPNLIPNSTAALGDKNWTVNSFVPTFVAGEGWGFTRVFGATGSITPTQMLGDYIACGANVDLSLQGVVEVSQMSAGTWSVTLAAYNGTTFLANVCSIDSTGANGLKFNHGRTPASTTNIRVITSTAAVTSSNSAGYLRVSRIKVEKGLTPTPWSNEADMASVATRVSGAEANISTNAQAISDEASARAQADSSLHASLGVAGHGMLNNARFTGAITSGIPAGWATWNNAGAATLVNRVGISTAKCYRLPGDASTNNGILQNISTNDIVVAGRWYLARASAWLQSGTYNGAGLYISWRNSSGTEVGTKTISFANTPATNGITANNHVGLTTWEQRIQAPAGAARVIFYVMSHWSTHSGGNTVANSIDWYEADLMPETYASALVSEVKGALVDGTGAYAYYGWKLDAGGYFVGMESIASSKTQQSAIKFTANTFLVKTASTNKQILTVTGDQVSINADLNVASSITVGAARLKVALESFRLAGADGAAITWASGASIGNIPEVVLDLSSLAPLTTGEQYSVGLTGVTPVGATINAKIITPGTTTIVSSTVDAAGGGGAPDRVMAKTDSADAYNGIYTFRIVGVLYVQSVYDSDALQYSNTGSMQISLWFNDGGGWDEGPWTEITIYDVGVSPMSVSPQAGSYGFDVTRSVYWGSPIGAGGTYDFGVAKEYASHVSSSITDLHTVSYLKQTASGTRTASPDGQQLGVTVFPRNA